MRILDPKMKKFYRSKIYEITESTKIIFTRKLFFPQEKVLASSQSFTFVLNKLLFIYFSDSLLHVYMPIYKDSEAMLMYFYTVFLVSGYMDIGWYTHYDWHAQ